jgi:hypothetical protein
VSVVRLRTLALVLVAAGVVALWATLPGCDGKNDSGGPTSAAPALGATDAILSRAFDERASGLEVEGAGTVVRVLADDERGSRHQRFIIRLDSGQTLLVAHNIDIAPRIPALAEGDAVAFRGEYEWNSQGGTVHWTHDDPSGDHPGGWLRSGGTTYR